MTNVFAVGQLSDMAPVARGGGGDDDRGGNAPAALQASQLVRSVRIGEALYAMASMLNHSCAPNTSLRFVGCTLELRAACNLSGEQAFSCYGPQVGHMGCAARRAALRATHYFDCGCAACVREQQEPQGAQRASGQPPGPPQQRQVQPDPKRPGQQHVRVRGHGGPTTSSGPWGRAGAHPSVEETRELAQRLDARALAACNAGDFGAAAHYSERALGALRTVFSEGDVQLAHEEAKLGRLRFNACADAAAAAALRRAADSLEAHGEAEEVADLRRLTAMCGWERSR
eukprot:3284272-Prymnesium_polylepis.1